VVSLLVEAFPKVSELPRLVKRQRLENHRFDYAEYRRRGTDAERQRNDFSDGKTERPTQLPQRITDVSTHTIQSQRGIRGRHSLFGCSRISEAKQCISTSLLGRHAAGDVVLDPHLDMRLEFGIDFLHSS
jgi:hypothetical protein